MPELARHPFGVLTGGEPQRGRGVSGLVRATFAQPKVPKDRIPDAIGDVAVTVGVAGLVAEHEVAIATDLVLVFQGLKYRPRHEDLALRTVGLDGSQVSIYQCLANEDFATVEVNVMPLQPVDFAGPHSGEEAGRVVVPKVRPDRGDDHIRVVEREWLYVCTPDRQSLDALHGRDEVVAKRCLVQHHSQRRDDVIHPVGGQRAAILHPSLSQLRAKLQYLGARDVLKMLITETRYQVFVDGARDRRVVGRSPANLVFVEPGFGECVETRGVAL